MATRSPSTESNILGTHVLLEAAKEARVKLFVHVSTDEVYGHGENGIPSHEGSPLEPMKSGVAVLPERSTVTKAWLRRTPSTKVEVSCGWLAFLPFMGPEKVLRRLCQAPSHADSAGH